jgi:hypothetical protein
MFIVYTKITKGVATAGSLHTRLLIKFCFRNPTPSEGKNRVKWQPFTTINHSYMNIGHDLSQKQGAYGIRPVKLKMELDLYKDRMEFWDSLPLNENSYVSQ